MKKIIISILILLLTFNLLQVNLFSQNGSGRNRTNPPKIGVISGQVLDANTKKPLQYFNILIKRVKDSKTVTGAITTKDGKFNIKEVPAGKYFAEVKFVGYQKEIIKEININRKKSKYNLGKIKMNESMATAEAITISEQKTHVEYRIDKKIINVSQDMTSAGGTAIEAMENVPAVEVDIEGDVTLRGSSNFTVFVNGRPSILGGSDALRQIPAESIDKIEIITNPSVKYDPDGMTGIVNVVLKKNIKRGFNGLVNLGIGLDDKYNGNISLNYFTGDWTFFTSYNYRNQKYAGWSEGHTNYMGISDTIYRTIENNRERNRIRKNNTFKGGIGYNFSDMTNITWEMSAGVSNHSRSNNAEISDWLANTDSTEYSISNNERERESIYMGTVLNLQHKFNDNGHQLDALFDFSTKESESPNTQEDFEANEKWEILQSAISDQNRSNEKSMGNTSMRFKLDYTKPLTEKSKLEAGYQYRHNEEEEEFVFENYNNDNEEWIINDLYSNNHIFSRDIHSAYTTYSGNIKKLEYLAGIRMEYTNRVSTSDTITHVFENPDYFPSLHTSYHFNDDNQLAASYSKRISRPRGWSLDPFYVYVDEYTRRQGNPDLKPEYSNSYELNYQYSFARSSYIALEAYHRQGENLITRIRTIEEDGSILYSYDNMDNDYSTGMELMFNWRPIKWFNISTSGSYYHYEIDTKLANDRFDTEINILSGKINLMLNLSENTRFQINGFYRGPSLSSQGEVKEMYGLNLALRQDFLNKKATVTLNVRDVLSTMGHEMTSYGTGFESYSHFWRDSPVVMLNFSYRINDYKVERKKERNGNNDDMDDI